MEGRGVAHKLRQEQRRTFDLCHETLFYIAMTLRTLLLSIALATALRAEFKAGAALRVITPDLKQFAPVYLAGFGENRLATGIHDPLYARCLALSSGAKPVVICGVDSIGLLLDDVERIRAQVGSNADVIVASNHGHEGPDTIGLWGPKSGESGLNEKYNAWVIERTAEAAREAIANLKPAQARLARENAPVLKTFLNDTRPPVVHDAELIMLALNDSRGRSIATLINWANHPEALASKNTLITADYLASVYKDVDTTRGGVTVFVNGAVGGMQSPLGAKVKDPRTNELAPKASFELAEVIGQRLARLAVDAILEAPETRIDTVEYRERRVRIPTANEGFKAAAAAGVFKGRKQMIADGQTETVIGYLRLARGKELKLEAACIPGELYPELSVGGIERYAGADFPDAALETPVKKQMTAPYRMLFGLANDEIGYIIPKAEWDNEPPFLQNAPKRWYGEVNSVGPEAAPVLLKAFAELLAR
jgi:hypothetical protein